jgi:O-antigen ligase
MTDVYGSRNYQSESGDVSADNNRFRVVWWQSVYKETMDKAPWFGLGFGYDLAAGFLREYYLNQHADFSVRSPHSIWLTMLGRMGIIGLVAFAVFAVLLFREAYLAARRVARGAAKPSTLANWCAAVILLGSASFGVVLEGPMGGILFWTFLGLAVSDAQMSATARVQARRALRAKPLPEPVLEPA